MTAIAAAAAAAAAVAALAGLLGLGVLLELERREIAAAESGDDLC